MGQINLNPRNGCALHGALQTVAAIGGVIPLLHATAGCGVQHLLATGYNDGGFDVPSTNVSEKQIIFGGTSRLREQLKNTLKVQRGSLYLVLSGCATELVGDDIPAMVKEARDQGYPVFYLKTPGFCGVSQQGYEIAVKGIIDQLADLPRAAGGEPGSGEEQAAEPNLVNIFGIVPNQNPFWQGDLSELSRILSEVGLEANALLGIGQDLAAWQRIPRAGLNLVFASVGLSIAQYLEAKFGQPYLYLDSLPIGLDGERYLVQQLEARVGLGRSKVDAWLQREEIQWNYYLQKFAARYFTDGFQRSFALVGQSSTIAGLAKLLTKPLGFIPKLLITTDHPGPSFLDSLQAEMIQLLPNQPLVVADSEDLREIGRLLWQSQAELVLGSALEKAATGISGGSLLQVSYPVDDRVILHKTYLGVNGGLALVEDLSRALLTNVAADYESTGS